MVFARFRRHPRGLRNHFATSSYSRRAAKLASILRFSASSLRHILGGFRRKSTTLYKKAAKFSQQKADFATLQSDLLAVAVTSSFQLRITHRLKHQILDFLSFEMVYKNVENGLREVLQKCKRRLQLAFLCFLHSVFPFSLLLSLHSFERLWQRAMKLQSLVLHEFELPKALPWIPNNSPQSWIVLVIKLLTKTPKLA